MEKQQDIDLTKMSLEQLKAFAYDQLAVIENAQRNLQTINQEIAKRPPMPVAYNKENGK